MLYTRSQKIINEEDGLGYKKVYPEDVTTVDRTKDLQVECVVDKDRATLMEEVGNGILTHTHTHTQTYTSTNENESGRCLIIHELSSTHIIQCVPKKR